MIIIVSLYIIASTLVGFFLVFPFVSVLLSLLVKTKKIPEATNESDLACIITAFKDVDITLPLIKSILDQRYSNFHIYLLADKCDVSKWSFEHKKFTLIKPEKDLQSKLKSMDYAVKRLNRAHDAIVIFDADNLAHPNCLKILNNYLKSGYDAVQGQRTAKNLDSVYAASDSTGEIYKNYVERVVPFKLGSSPTIAGSGMAIRVALFNEYLSGKTVVDQINDIGVIIAEDKVLQNNIVAKDLQIAYAPDAIIYDEKITSAQQVEKQRSRWLYTYFQNLRHATKFLCGGIFNLSINQFIFGILTVLPPLFILLLSGIILSLAGVFLHLPTAISLAIAIVIFAGNIIFTLALSKAPPAVWRSLWGIPLFIYNQILGLLIINQSKKVWHHTENKNKMGLDDVLKPEK